MTDKKTRERSDVARSARSEAELAKSPEQMAEECAFQCVQDQHPDCIIDPDDGLIFEEPVYNAAHSAFLAGYRAAKEERAEIMLQAGYNQGYEDGCREAKEERDRYKKALNFAARILEACEPDSDWDWFTISQASSAIKKALKDE